MAETELTLSGMNVPPYSARGLKMNLVPIKAATQIRRSINGELVDLSESQFRKYAATIKGGDQQPPAVNGIWPGQLVTVGAIVELCYATATGSPDRTVVAGSSRTEGSFTFYRPELDMMVVDLEINRDEWGAQVDWTLSLEEV